MKYILLLLLCAFVSAKCFSQETFPILVQYVKKETRGELTDYKLNLKFQNRTNEDKWVILIKNDGIPIETDSVELYRSCNHGCASIYKFVGQQRTHGFDAFQVPAGSTFRLNDFMIEGYNGKAEPEDIYCVVTTRFMVGGKAIDDMISDDPTTDKDLTINYHPKDRKYTKAAKINLNPRHGQEIPFTWIESSIKPRNVPIEY